MEFWNITKAVNRGDRMQSGGNIRPHLNDETVWTNLNSWDYMSAYMLEA